MVENTNSSSD
jgi:hypothetical protein